MPQDKEPTEHHRSQTDHIYIQLTGNGYCIGDINRYDCRLHAKNTIIATTIEEVLQAVEKILRAAC